MDSSLNRGRRTKERDTERQAREGQSEQPLNHRELPKKTLRKKRTKLPPFLCYHQERVLQKQCVCGQGNICLQATRMACSDSAILQKHHTWTASQAAAAQPHSLHFFKMRFGAMTERKKK